MRKFLWLIGLFVPVFLFCNPVDLQTARQKAGEWIAAKSVANAVTEVSPLMGTNHEVVAFLATLAPQGFILLSCDDEIHPILAYSFLDDFTSDPAEMAIMQSWLGKVHASYVTNLAASQRILNQQKWHAVLTAGSRFEQWPPAGSTATGGWLEENWSQGNPYNQYCPLDPTTSARCVAGCPSIVMSQILNYHRELNDTQFSDDDDYHMYYSSSNHYFIDTDYLLYDFASYPELNTFLTDIEAVYAGPNSLTDEMKAALVFSSGAAIKQVFSSSVSGNYYDQQILNGFHKFGFSTTELLWEYEPLVFIRLQENMKDGLPARLGILSGSAGHQIVVDGYNTNEEYHFNFGWGGNSNGWYSFPLSGMPYQLNIFGSVDVDINQTWNNCPNFEISSPSAGSVFTSESTVPVDIVSTGFCVLDSLTVFIDNDLLQTGNYPLSCLIPLTSLENGNHKVTIAAFGVDKKVRVKTVDFELARGEVVFAENFDNGWENNWEITSGNPDYTWQILENSLESFSETNSNNVTSATCPLAYSNLNEVMVSPEITLPQAEELHWNFYVGFCDNYPSYPAITAAISTDHGQNWTTLWQTSTSLGEFTWKYISLDLTAYAGETINIKYSCSGFSYADVSIDGIRIFAPLQVETSNELTSPKLVLTNYPNPFNPSTTISFDLTA
ncbi:MAG TPA: C10 family peptidase, partial [Candidatus Cloacimonadota bacterium]|nr:C10 family peptidase [Candidatus Cloacimonadota bacterium]